MWTMIDGFQGLNATEIDALVEAPILITILVGAADGALDREERYWAERLMRTRTYSRPRALHDYYRVVATSFLDKVDAKMRELPTDAAKRNEIIAHQLTRLNEILPRLEPHLGSDLYRSFTGLAEETAEASGGFLRIGAISAAEAEWYKLPMIQPVARPLEDVYEEEEGKE
jgi:hypothetical protein